MHLQNGTVIVAAFYIAVIGAGGVAAGITSPAAWVTLSALALLPSCSMLLVWSQRAQTPPAVQGVLR